MMQRMDDSVDSSSDEDDTTTTQTINQPKEEELVTRLQLRLAASHLPRVGRFKLSRRSPDTFATVASIFRKSGANRRPSPSHKGREHLSSSFSFETMNADNDYMVEWGSTEV